MNFDELQELRNFLAAIRDYHVPTMNYYASADEKGFWHQASKREEASLSSTATCVASLVRAGRWGDESATWGSSEQVCQKLLERPWRSAGLKANNSFSIAFIAQGVLDLTQSGLFNGSDDFRNTVSRKIIPLLVAAIETADPPFGAPGSVSIKPYPPSAYLTQLAYRVVCRAFVANDPTLMRIKPLVRAWSRSEVYRQLALIDTRSRIADPLQLAYAIILLATSLLEVETSPEEKSLIRKALAVFFSAQQEDGTWPPSQPIFHYPSVGNAQGFEYELLSELLRCDSLSDDLLPYLSKLKAAAYHLEQTAFHLGPDVRGWASGHHPQIGGPESWSTACVFDYVSALDRLVAEAVRKSLFAELKAPYNAPVVTQGADGRKFAPDFLDATVKVGAENCSLKQTLFDHFVAPIDREANLVAKGGKLSKSTPMSAILYGPPGTSKTQLAKLVGKYLGWPHVVVDPSYVVQDGLDRLYARANHLFSILSSVERVVVLLDEFDELGRDRANETEVLSRFITTAMLPKLAAINDERKIVFLLATNYLGRFDAAFRRGGRFDMIIQIMQPKLDAKLGNPDWRDTLHSALAKLKGKKLTEAREWLDKLTYLETEQLVIRLGGHVDDVHDEIKTAHDAGTLMRENYDQKNWRQTCSDEEDQIRLPEIQEITEAPELPLPGVVG